MITGDVKERTASMLRTVVRGKLKHTGGTCSVSLDEQVVKIIVPEHMQSKDTVDVLQAFGVPVAKTILHRVHIFLNTLAERGIRVEGMSGDIVWLKRVNTNLYPVNGTIKSKLFLHCMDDIGVTLTGNWMGEKNCPRCRGGKFKWNWGLNARELCPECSGTGTVSK